MRELTSGELDYVAGGTYDCCYCGCPSPEPQSAGNPGNLKAVGNAGEKGPSFIFGGYYEDANGRTGNSSNPRPGQ